MANIISFYGTDGSGKSTIATEFSLLHPVGDSVMLGGSSYKEWLTPEVAKITLGEKHMLGEPIGEVEDKIRLYEDIAIACYGLGHILADRGSEVVIDSDPIFKRIIWGTLGLSDEDAAEYVRHFEDRAQDVLGESSGADVIVGVNMEDSQASAADILSRLTGRESNTEHDPTDINEMLTLDERVNNVWAEINLAKSGLSTIASFNKALTNSAILTVQNPNCSPEQIIVQAKDIALELRSKISI